MQRSLKKLIEGNEKIFECDEILASLQLQSVSTTSDATQSQPTNSQLF